METTNSKSRTSSRCREWERQRRIKFNEAISKLGDLVKEINRSNCLSAKDADNVQYPKVEIIQKAIICLTNYVQEKTKMKAEILALQVEIDVIKNKTSEKQDASTQVFLSLGRKCQYDKQLKFQMAQKSIKSKNPSKEKPKLKNNKKVLSSNIKPKFPILLPRSNLNNDKKHPENTIVVLPATPYIFPQRPLLFPTVPPAIVLVDPNLQNLNKVTGSIVNRSNGDVTKTTTVNILPISAYSRPLSATKTRKNITKSKKENLKKASKLDKKPEQRTVDAENKDKNENKVVESAHTSTSKITNNKSENELKEKNLIESKIVDSKESHVGNSVSNKVVEPENSVSLSHNVKDVTCKINSVHNVEQSKEKDVIEDAKINNNLSTSLVKKNDSPNTAVGEKTPISLINGNADLNKFTKTSIEKATTEVKEKENKLTNILDTSLCDTVVDGGNARLELAEEFLAASPTAAFLMSFPLVSGNRADSPAEEPQNSIQNNSAKETRRSEGTTHTINNFFDKSSINDPKLKTTQKLQTPIEVLSKPIEPHKYTENNFNPKQTDNKATNVTNQNASNENPFLNLPMPSLISTNCTISDSTFGLDFDCNINKTIPSQSTSYSSNNNLFYKSDPFNTVKNSIYSTSSISSSHDFNNIGLYPCAMEKFSSKSKCDYSNVEDNLMKIGSSRLTYDIDLGWSHKSFDFVNCTTSSNTLNKDNILTTVSTAYSTTYNPFNPEFHMPLVSNSTKKDFGNKTSTSFADTVTSFYSQPTNLWTEDVPFYTNNSIAKTTTTKHNYLNVEPLPINNNTKQNEKHYGTTAKHSDTGASNLMKSTNATTVDSHISEKYTKKSPTKMHINWMTSEIRHMEPHCNPLPVDVKNGHKSSFPQLNHLNKKQENNESYFPITMHNFVPQSTQEEFQMWPSARTIGPTEITIEPPPINLPTLVGDLALGPHDKKKISDISGRTPAQTQDLQNCSNFLSVTQLMNRSSDNMPSRYQAPNAEIAKTSMAKHISNYFTNEVNRKSIVSSSRIDSQLPQPCYGFNDSKPIAGYESMSQFSHNKNKTNKSEKSSKTHKNSYSAEALLRGGNFTQKFQENSGVKFAMPSQKYNEFNATQDSAIAQVSHFPPIIDYSDNSYTSQQFSGTTLYNTTTNTISNSFYSNLMPGSSNLMPSNYTSAPFAGEFIDYSQSECNYNHKYEDLKMRNNHSVFPQEKVPSNYKPSRRESATKHKLDCSKKESNKKYQNKRAKLNNEVEEWNDPTQLWQNKVPSKRHGNVVSDELTFPNYAGNQMPAQYQPEIFNSHLVPANVQSVGQNVDRTLSFPATSRANFNLSTIFPEITMKVQ